MQGADRKASPADAGPGSDDDDSEQLVSGINAPSVKSLPAQVVVRGGPETDEVALEWKPGDAEPAGRAADPNRHDSTQFYPNLDRDPSESESSSSAALWVLPRPFGEYVLEREIARGGMGVVFEARQASVNRTVALKMIKTEQLASSSEVQRFLIEAEAAANLDHPNIVPIYEVGRSEGCHYYTMKLIDGGNLHHSGKRYVNDLKSAVKVIIKAARAVHAAHMHGILHRDIKPANVLLDSNGDPHVVDFGLAKRLNQDSGITLTGAVLGTPTYMAPEQTLGVKGVVTTASDVYSLGAILYELITGKPPFRGDSPMEILLQVYEKEPERPRSFNPLIGRDLETICLKAIEKRPKSRYRSAEALADDLTNWLEGRPISARPVGKLSRMWMFCVREPVLSGLAAALVLALASGTIVATYFAVSSELQRRSALFEKRLSDHRTYTAEINLAQQAWREGETELVVQRLDRQIPTRLGVEDFRGFEWHYLRRLCSLSLRTLQWRGNRASDVAFSADGRRIAVAGGAPGKPGEIKILDAVTGKELFSIHGSRARTAALAYSPDGRLIASCSGAMAPLDSRIPSEMFSPVGPGGPGLGSIERGGPPPDRPLPKGELGDQSARRRPADQGPGPPPPGGPPPHGPVELKVWDASTGKEVFNLVGHRLDVRAVAFSPDGLRLASAGGDSRAWQEGEIKIWSMDNGVHERSLEAPPARVNSIAFSPDSRRLAAVGLGKGESTDTLGLPGVAKVWDLSNGAVVWEAADPDTPFFGLAYHPKGGSIAISGGKRGRAGEVQVRESESGEQTLVIHGHSTHIFKVIFSPDGKRLATAGRESVVRIWDYPSGLEAMSLRGHSGDVMGIAYSPEGRRLASVGWDMDDPRQPAELKIWDAYTTHESLQLLGHERSISSLVFSPDGKSVISADFAGALKVWDPTKARAELTFSTPSGPVFAIAAADGALAVAGGGYKKHGFVEIWDYETGKRLGELEGHSDRVIALAASPKGGLLASAGLDREVKIWNIYKLTLIKALPRSTAPIRGLAFSPSGTTLAAATNDGMIELWDVENGKKRFEIQAHSPTAACVAFSPDGRTIVSGGSDHQVKLWRVKDGALFSTLVGHSAPVRSVDFSPDGKRIVSGGLDLKVRLWDAVVGREILELDGHSGPGPVTRAIFSPDGGRIASGGWDKAVRIWDSSPPTPEILHRDEALSLVQFVLSRSKSREDARAAVQADATINDSVRAIALGLLNDPGSNAPNLRAE